jgi:type I restriction enzyme, S subunit
VSWSRARLDWLTSVSREVIDPSALGDEEVVHYSIPALDALGGPAVEPASSIASTKLRVRGGEVLVSKLNPRKLRVVIAQRHEKPAMASGEFIPLRPRNIEPQFLSYWLQSETTRQDLDGATQSVTRSHQRVTPDVLTKKWLKVPNLADQRAIADFLDTETTRIDALIERKQRLAELAWIRLKELARHLTTGDGTSLPLRRVAQRVKTGATPTADVIVDEGTEWVTPGDFTGHLEVAPSARRIRAEALGAGGLPVFEAGSVLIIGIGATAGRVGYIDRPVSGNQQVTAIQCGERVLGEFLAWQLHVRTAEMRALGPYTTLPILNNDFLKSLPIALADLETQRRAVEQLRVERTRVGHLVGALDRQVELLREHRQALITAAVTGDLKVPGVAA